MKKLQINGYLFEVIIGTLLGSVGYRWEISSGNRKLKGRGAYHEIDAIGLGSNNITPFVSNIRLLAEAKYYEKKHIGLPVVRNMFGVLTDINESYIPDDKPIIEKLIGKRETNCAVIFSNSQFSEGAINFGYAHNIYLVSYSGNPLMESILRDFRIILSLIDYRKFPKDKNELKNKFYNLLTSDNWREINFFKENTLESTLINSVNSLRKKLSSTVSVLGFIQGSYPIQIMSRSQNLANAILSHSMRNGRNIGVYYHFRQVGDNLLFNFEIDGIGCEFTLPIFLFKKSIEENSMIDAKKMYLGRISIPITTIEQRNVQIIDLIFDENYTK